MLTPNDIANPNRISGYDHVRYDPAGSRVRPYRAGWGMRSGPGTSFHGARRATGEEAAQDYCDHVNGQGNPRKPRQPQRVGALTVSLNRARHKSRPRIAKGALRRKARGDGRQAKKLGFVYLIGEELAPGSLGDRAKIGYSQDATLRIGTLQSGNPRKLVLLGTVRGTEADEKEYHAQFKPLNENNMGEWFRLTPEVLSEFGIDKEMIA